MGGPLYAVVRDESTGKLVMVPLAPGGGGGGGGAVTGDLDGTVPGSIEVTGLRTRQISTTAPRVQMLYVWDGDFWVPVFPQGVKKHLRAGDTVLVPADYEYITKGSMILDPGATLTVVPGGEQTVL